MLLSRSPLEARCARVSGAGVVEAVRLALIAELDAINLYEQLASAIDDEGVRRVFLDVAREEKAHVGEFLALLKRLDPGQARELEAGEREVLELLGERERGQGRG